VHKGKGPGKYQNGGEKEKNSEEIIKKRERKKKADRYGSIWKLRVLDCDSRGPRRRLSRGKEKWRDILFICIKQCNLFFQRGGRETGNKKFRWNVVVVSS
jgi:hypothetical protein